MYFDAIDSEYAQCPITPHVVPIIVTVTELHVVNPSAVRSSSSVIGLFDVLWCWHRWWCSSSTHHLSQVTTRVDTRHQHYSVIVAELHVVNLSAVRSSSSVIGLFVVLWCWHRWWCSSFTHHLSQVTTRVDTRHQLYSVTVTELHAVNLSAVWSSSSVIRLFDVLWC